MWQPTFSVSQIVTTSRMNTEDTDTAGGRTKSRKNESLAEI